MTNPADSDQLHNTVSLHGATIGRHVELLQNLMEGLHTLAERHDQGFKSLLKQFHGLSIRQHATTETSRTLSNHPTSRDFVQPTSASREPHLPPRGALCWGSWNLPGVSFPVLPHLWAAALFISFGSFEDSVCHNADVWKGAHLGYGGLGATFAFVWRISWQRW
jgi:hypothetical protein